MLTDVRTGYTNVQSETGIALRRLEQTDAFGRYDFGWGPEPWWIPEPDFQKIMERSFPGCDLCSRAEMLQKVPYSSWKAFQHAVTKAESAFNFYVDGPLVVTAASSFTAGAERLQAVMDERSRAGQEKGFLLVWTK